MEIKKCYTEKSFKQLVELLKSKGYIFKGYTWQSAIFDKMVVMRVY